MKNAYSHDLLADFVNSEEHKLLEETHMAHNKVGPSEWTIQKILGFSKSLSVRKSSVLGSFEQTLN